MSKRCDSVTRRLSGFIDGELPADEARRILDHIRDCPDCGTTHRELLAMDRAVREEMKNEEIDSAQEEQARTRLLARLKDEPAPAWARRNVKVAPWWRRPPVTFRWAGGIAVVATVVLLALRFGTPDVPEPMQRGPAPEMKTEKLQAAEQPSPTVTAAKSEADEAPVSSRIAPLVRAQAKVEMGASRAAKVEDRALSREPAERAMTDAVQDEPPPRVEVTPGAGDATTSAQVSVSSPTVASEAQGPAAGSAMKEVEALPVDEVHDLIRGGSSYSRTVRIPEGGRENETKLLTFSLGKESELPVSPSDSLEVSGDLPDRLGEAEAILLSSAVEDSTSVARQAREWRLIGDLWEWLGRQTKDPAAFARAVAAYERAAAADANAAGLDSSRVRRAVEGSAGERGKGGNKETIGR